MGGRDFPHLSSPALGPTQPPVQWAPGLSRRLKRPGRGANHPPISKRQAYERVGLYLYSQSGPQWPVIGRRFLLNFMKSGGKNVKWFTKMLFMPCTKECLSLHPTFTTVNSRSMMLRADGQ